MIYELRSYYAHPGKMGALQKRFRDHTCKLFEKHGITNVGYWTNAIGGRNEGISTASSNNPSGSIHRPNTGRMLNTPPTIRNPAVGIRHNLACGWRNARDLRAIQSGRRAS